MRILISGAGIAGPTLAYWLAHHGFEPTLVERAPALRTGGYIIDFWGSGFDVAERMGLLPEIQARGYRVREVRIVDRAGHRVGGFDTRVFDRLTGGRFLSLPRGDLAAALFSKVAGRVEALFGESITSLEEDAHGVHVNFERASPRSFDLVVGADGLHSNVRRHVFGEQGRFERYLGYRVAAFETTGYRPRDELTYIMYTQVGQQVARFAMRGDRTLFLLIFADPDERPGETLDLAAQKRLLRERFRDSGWECRPMLDALEATGELYFDRVSQIRMEAWTRGRVALVGDAAFCVSLLAGQGSALAMAAAYVLAGELKAASGDHVRAFRRYQEMLGAFTTGKQRATVRYGETFTPRSALRLLLRNQLSKLLSIPFVADLAIRRDVTDQLHLSEY